MKNLNKKTGYTLIETLVVMSITIVAGVLLVVIMVNSTGLFTQQSSKVAEGLSVNDSLMQIRNAIKTANSIAVNYTNGAQTFTTGPTQLILKVPSLDSSNNIISDKYDYYVFYVDQKTLHFKIFPDVLSSRQAKDQIFSTSVDNINFQYFNTAVPPMEVIPINALKVRVTLTLKQRVGINFETNTATSEANLRNG